MGKKGKHRPTPKRKPNDESIEELNDRVTSFGLCLSAVVAKHGQAIEQGDRIIGQEYVLRLEDFQRIAESNVSIENMGDIDGEAGTLVRVIFPTVELEIARADATET